MYYLELSVGSKCSIAHASEYTNDSILIQNAKIVSRNLNHVILTMIKKESDEAIEVMKDDFKTINQKEYMGNQFIDSYKVGHGMLKAIQSYDAFLLYPIIARNGAENFRLISKEKNILESIRNRVSEKNSIESELLENISLAEIISGNLTSIASPSLYGLTDKEISTLKIALSSGYYDWPRKNDLGDISANNGSSKVTTLYHIRKAEKKIIANIFKKAGK
jgi:predicted DNA binding protein